MSKSVVRNLIIAIAVVYMLPSTVLANHIPPHSIDGDPAINCNSCHSVHQTLGKAGNVSGGGEGHVNACLTCHHPGRVSGVYGPLTPFVPADMATNSGPSRGKVQQGKMQTSHRWEGSDDVPKAGALPSTNPQLNGSNSGPTGTNINFLGDLSCARCHAIHARTDVPTSQSPPFIRANNEDDAFCLDCHRPRNSTTHTTGTHPVGVNYANVAAQKPNEYYAAPVNSNPANPTSDLSKKKLQNGTTGPITTVVCTTCHGIHFSDSNSATFDNVSSALFGRLSSSAGYLLKTDLKGKDTSAKNICTNCHITTVENANAKVKNHSSKTLGKEHDNQCADCHGGHVDEADKSIPNAFLVRRFMPVSSSMGKTPMVLFQYTSGERKNYNKDAYGVCVSCHPGQLPTSVSQHTSTDARVCNTCHTHKAGFSAECTTCHGFPPVENQVADGINKGYADGYQLLTGYADESVAGHATHATGSRSNSNYGFSCMQCHNGNNHNTSPVKTFQDVFLLKTGIIASTGAPPQPEYNPVTRTCANVYCHSNGLPVGNNPRAYKVVAWPGANGTINGCSACHDEAPATNAHTKHIAKYTCDTCHVSTVTGNSTINETARLTGGLHVNGVRDVKFGTVGGKSLASGIYNSSDYTCANLYCHSNGKDVYPTTLPKWTDSATAQCGSCHTVTASQLPDAHQAHLVSTYGPKLTTYKGSPAACYFCHNASQHINGLIEPFNASCSTSCHNNGAPAWVAGRITPSCTTCHAGNVSFISYTAGVNIYAPDKTLASSDGHGRTGGADQPCTSCHNQDSAHISKNPSDHDKRLISDLNPAVTNNECNFCHNNAGKINTASYRNMSTHFLVKDGPQAMRCAACHDPHAQKNINGTANKWMVRSKIAFINSTAWDVTFTNTSTGFIQADNRGICQVCHSQTKFYRSGIAETGHPTRNCLQCHPHRAAGGAFSPAGSCDTCHGYPPVPRYATVDTFYEYPDPKYRTTFGRLGNFTSARFEDYTGGGGAHLKHVPTYAKATDGWKHCALCHSGGNESSPSSHKAVMDVKQHVSNVTVQVNQAANFNNSLQIIYSGAKLVNPPDNRTGSCVNVSCHFQPSPRWSKDR